MYLCKDYIFFRYKKEYIKIFIYQLSDLKFQFNFCAMTKIGV